MNIDKCYGFSQHYPEIAVRLEKHPPDPWYISLLYWLLNVTREILPIFIFSCGVTIMEYPEYFINQFRNLFSLAAI